MATVAKRKKVSTFQFEDLPVEIRIKVISYLDIKGLLRCNQVSKKTRALCQDESLWQKIDLSWKFGVPYSFVQFVLEKKCKSLLLRSLVLPHHWFCFKIRFRFIYQCTYISEISL